MSFYDEFRDIDYTADAEWEAEVNERGGYFRLVVELEDREGYDPNNTGGALEADCIDDAVDEALDWLRLDKADNFLWVRPCNEQEDTVFFALSLDPITPDDELDGPQDIAVCGKIMFVDA